MLGGLAWALTRGTAGEDTPAAGGAQRVEVPGVVSLPLGEARGRLGDAGLELGSQTEAASDEIAAGAVTEQNPPAGTEAERGTAVDVVVSTGPAPEPTTLSSSATSTATAAPTASPPAGRAGAAQGREEAREKAQEAAEQAQEAREEAKEREKERIDAQKERGKK